MVRNGDWCEKRRANVTLAGKLMTEGDEDDDNDDDESGEDDDEGRDVDLARISAEGNCTGSISIPMELITSFQVFAIVDDDADDEEDDVSSISMCLLQYRLAG